MLYQAVQHHQLGQIDDAEGLYRRILAHHPSHADALHLLGLVHYARGEFAAATEQVRRAVAVAPQSAVYHFNLGNILRDAGESSAALAAYRQAVALQPDEADYHNNLGLLLEETGALDDATASYRSAVEHAPVDATPWVNLAAALQQQGQVEEATQCYCRALQLEPRHAQALNNLGGLLQAAGDYAAASRCYLEAVQAAPELAEAHRNYGGMLEAAGDSEGALRHYTEALRLKPDYAEVAYVLAALRGTAAPVSAPGEYVAALFDQYADGFDEHLTGVLGYRTPAMLRALYDRCATGHVREVFDLGCGTGLAGMAFRDLAAHLAGVDLSPRMVEKARERDIYHALEIGDVVAALQRRPGSWDLLLAADVLVYIGDLGPVFAAARSALRPGGWLLFSVERGDAECFVLREAGRYAHSAAYVREMAGSNGFAVRAEEAAVLRQNLGVDVPGWLYALQLA